MHPTDAQALATALQQLQQASATSGSASAFLSQVLGAFLATIAVLIPALFWLRGRLPALIRAGLKLEAADQLAQHELDCPARVHYHQRAGDSPKGPNALGVVLALVLLASTAQGCQPFLELAREADVKGAYWCDVDKAAGELYPQTFCRTLSSSQVDYLLGRVSLPR